MRPGQRRAHETQIAEPIDEDDEDAGDAEGDGAVIGAHTPPPVRTVPLPSKSVPGKVKRRPIVPASYSVDHTTKPMPSLYGGHRILQYWYVPAAILLAVAVAFGVIWVAGQFDDGSSPAQPSPTATPASATSAAAVSPAATSSVTVPAGKFQANDPVVVTGVGPGSGSEAGCLNVRTEPGTTNPAIVCVPDGTQLTVLGGPQEAGGLIWWKVKSTSGDGWAAEEYLAKR